VPKRAVIRFGVISVIVFSRVCNIGNVQVSEFIPCVEGWNHPPPRTVPRFEHDIIFIRLECIQAKGVSCGVYASRVYLYPYSWLPVRNVDERGSSTRVIWIQEILPAGAPMPSSDEGFVSFHITLNEMNNH